MFDLGLDDPALCGHRLTWPLGEYSLLKCRLIPCRESEVNSRCQPGQEPHQAVAAAHTFGPLVQYRLGGSGHGTLVHDLEEQLSVLVGATVGCQSQFVCR